jgi:hypothetical protein
VVQVVTLDLKQAFYRIRLCDKRIPLKCDGASFVSDRVTFGVRYGPMALERVVRAMVWKALSSSGQPRLKVFYYLDDITIIGNDTSGFVEELFRVAETYGFEFPSEKRHFITLRRKDNAYIPDDFESFTHLGVIMCKVQDAFCMKCMQREPPSCLKEITRRAGFQVAGLGYDPLLMHGERCYAADLIRRMVNSKKWDERIEVDSEEWKKLVSQLHPVDCCHPVLTEPIKTVSIWTDASLYGYGYVVQLNGTTVIRRARVWSSKQALWHINRKEYFASVEALLTLNHLTRSFSNVTLTFFTDSKSGKAWLEDKKSKSLDRACIQRLANLRDELVDLWKEDGHIKEIRWNMIKGDENAEADILSRLGQEWRLSRSLVTGIAPDQTLDTLNVASALGGRGVPEDVDIERMLGSLISTWNAWKDANPRSTIESLRELIREIQDESIAIRAQRDYLKTGALSGFSSQVLQKQTEFRLIVDGMVMQLRFAFGDISKDPTLVLVLDAGTKIGGEFIKLFVKRIHEDFGHCTARYVTWRVSKTFTTQNVKKIACEIVGNCPTCYDKARSNLRRQPYLVQSSLDTTATHVFDVVSIDLFTVPVDRRIGNLSYILVVVDHFSRFVVIAALVNKTAATIEEMLDLIFSLYLQPNLIRSDNAREFKKLSRKKKWNWYRIPPYSPFSNGICERVMATLGELIKLRNWDKKLHKWQRRLNGKKIDELGYSPVELMFGADGSSLSMPQLEGETLALLGVVECEAYLRARDKLRLEVLRLREQRMPSRPPPVKTELTPGTRVIRTYDGKEVGVVKSSGTRVIVEDDNKKRFVEHLRNLRMIPPVPPGGRGVVLSDREDLEEVEED